MRLALLMALLVLACSSKAPPPPLAPMKDVAVVVNGRPISELEIQMRRRDRPTGAPLVSREVALERVLTMELAAQRAEELGLDKEPYFQAEMERVATQLRDARRHELAKMFRLKEVVQKAKPTEADITAYFDTHARRIRTEYHLQQLYANARAAAEQDRADLLGGARFEDVALARAKTTLKTVPEGFKPYELAPMTFDLVPAEWWPALDTLKPGEVSEVIAMPKDRFAIIRLVETQELPEATLEAVRPRIEAMLREKAIENRRIELEAELRRAAKVELRAVQTPSDPDNER